MKLAKKISILSFLLIFLISLSFFIKEEEEKKKIPEKSLEEIVENFLGTPYKRGPMDEENLYREDVFDCTTLVLVTASILNSGERSPEEMIKEINYYPPGEVSYENRLHFTSYRNKASPFFEDITKEVGGDKVKRKEVVLNKTGLIDIDWEKKIDLYYIKVEDILSKEKLPTDVGVAFINELDEEIGLDVRHEGFLFNGSLVHASSASGEVVRENFSSFLKNSNYYGVILFKLKYEV